MTRNSKIHEECGIFAGFSHKFDIAPIIKCALLKLQHRGQESAGIAAGDAIQKVIKKTGLVNNLKDSEIAGLFGKFGLGHVRYSTFGGQKEENAQPIKITYLGEDVSLAHNGQVQQALKIKEKFERIGEVFLSSSDSEVILKRIVFSLKKPPSKWTFQEVGDCLSKNFDLGSYCIAIYTPERILAYRDPFGFRPLMFAKCKEGNFLASEDVAFFGLNVEKIVEIEAGFGVEITQNGYEIKNFANQKEQKCCVFEQIYFASPSSNIFNQNVYESRVELGRLLAATEEPDFSADVVIPVPASGLASAIGYHEVSKIPFHIALTVNNWQERSFIRPNEASRALNVKLKFIPIKSQIENKNVVLVDDSLVRGTTSKEIVTLLKNAGAKSVHVRSSAPRIINKCTWGVDIPTCEELIAFRRSDVEIAKLIGADSVRFLPLEHLKDVFKGGVWCNSCFINKNGVECGL